MKIKLIPSAAASFLWLIFIIAVPAVVAQTGTELVEPSTEAQAVIESEAQAVKESEAVIEDQGAIEIETENQSNIFDRQLIAELDAQQELLLAALQEEGTFSLKLSELYAEYGAVLLRSGRLDEASEVYKQALHIQKVNHGIYSAEQLYFIKNLVDVAIKINDDELVDQYLNQAISIERKNAGLVSEHLREMYISAGHYFVDRYYQQSGRYNVKLALLQKSQSYFEKVLIRSRNKTLDQALIPYGELLLVSYLESTILSEMPIVSNGLTERFNSSALSSSPTDIVELQRDYAYVKGAFDRSLRYINSYVSKARSEGNNQEEINAILSWADTLILFKENQEAEKYYKLAWEKSLDILSSERLLNRFNQPRRIPAYNYLINREDELSNQDSIRIPLTFSVAIDGSVSNVQITDSGDDHREYFTRARNEVNRLHFRPAVIDGEVTAVEEFTYDVRVIIK